MHSVGLLRRDASNRNCIQTEPPRWSHIARRFPGSGVIPPCRTAPWRRKSPGRRPAIRRRQRQPIRLSPWYTAAGVGVAPCALLAAMKAGDSTAFADRYRALAPVIDQVFNLEAVLAASIGLSWATLPVEQ